MGTLKLKFHKYTLGKKMGFWIASKTLLLFQKSLIGNVEGLLAVIICYFYF